MMGPTPEVEAAVLEGLDAAAKVQVADEDNVSILSKEGNTVLKLKRKLILIEEQAWCYSKAGLMNQPPAWTQ